MLARLLNVGGGTLPPVTSDEVFAVNVFTGTGVSQTITNGINLSGKGGLVWEKQRSAVQSSNLIDTVNGAGKYLSADLLGAQVTNAQYLSSFTSTGFNTGTGLSVNTVKHCAWVFREAPKFFDVVTYTGDGTGGRAIPHSLGIAPGFIITKSLTGSSAWRTYHIGTSTTSSCYLQSDAAANGEGTFPTTPTAASFFVGSAVNGVGTSYVAYLFAHDVSSTGIVQCGSFTADASGNATLALGWEPQFLMVKSSSAIGDWIMLDSTRGWNTSVTDAKIAANTTAAETEATEYGEPTATGFNFKGGVASAAHIFLAIRIPNAVPTSGTKVLMPSTRTGTGAAAVATAAGFTTDLLITKKRSSTTLTGARFVDRLRGKTRHIGSTVASAEVATADTVTNLDSNTGVTFGADATISAFNTSTHTYIDLLFKRARSVFDIVCDTGTGAAHTVAHSLGVIPELIIRKGRSGATQWEVYCSSLVNTEKLVLNSTAAKATDTTAWNSTTPTTSVFTVGTGANVNTNAATYVSYLFATLAGVSKVGAYTGNGTSLNIDCGFTTGARFVLIKQTNSTGDWFIWDTVRGVIAGNDPHLSLNTTAAEVTTDDSIDPLTTGFTVNQLAATNINVTSATYIYLAIA